MLKASHSESLSEARKCVNTARIGASSWATTARKARRPGRKMDAPYWAAAVRPAISACRGCRHEVYKHGPSMLSTCCTVTHAQLCDLHCSASRHASRAVRG